MVMAKINGEKCYFKTYKEMAAYVMVRLRDSQSPLEAKVKNLSKLMEMMNFGKRAQWASEIKTERLYEKYYWETLLSLEEIGRLRGFRVNHMQMNTKAICVDPERDRLSTDWNIFKDL